VLAGRTDEGSRNPSTPTAQHLTYLVTEYGQPYSAKAFGNRFKEWCRAAGLPDCCTLHGVRKHTASQLAEEGATPHQIGS
jgi:integrase/recombinase XerD